MLADVMQISRFQRRGYLNVHSSLWSQASTALTKIHRLEEDSMMRSKQTSKCDRRKTTSDARLLECTARQIQSIRTVFAMRGTVYSVSNFTIVIIHW